MQCAIWVEVRVLFGRIEYEAFSAFEKAIQVVVEVMVLVSYESKCAHSRNIALTRPDVAPSFDRPSQRFTC